MNFLRYFWCACSGFRSYTAFLALPVRSAVGYWMALSALLAVAFMLQATSWFRANYPRALDESMREIPAFHIAKGRAVSALPQPYYANTNAFPIILDLESRLKEPLTQFPAGLLVRPQELTFWFPDTKPMTIPLSQLPEGEFNRQYLETLCRSALDMAPFFYLFAWIGIAAAGLVQALLFTALAMLLERSMEPGFNFRQVFNLTVFALTPGAFIVAVYSAVGFHDISYGLIHFSCYGFFLIMGSAACRASLRPKRAEPSDGDGE